MLLDWLRAPTDFRGKYPTITEHVDRMAVNNLQINIAVGRIMDDVEYPADMRPSAYSGLHESLQKFEDWLIVEVKPSDVL